MFCSRCSATIWSQSDVFRILTREAHITRRSRHHARRAHHVPRKQNTSFQKQKHFLRCAFVFGAPCWTRYAFAPAGSKIMVATSVCTGCRKCSPDFSSAMGLCPSVTCNKKHRVASATLCFLGVLNLMTRIKSA